MDDRQRLSLSTWSLLIGGVLSLGWAVSSLLGLFEVKVGGVSRVLGALGPLGIVLVILGGLLCRWDLPALRRRVKGE